jgi:hypothetical protein
MAKLSVPYAEGVQGTGLLDYGQDDGKESKNRSGVTKHPAIMKTHHDDEHHYSIIGRYGEKSAESLAAYADV